MIIDKGTDLSFQVKLVDVDNTEIQPSEVTDLSVRVFTTNEDAYIIASVDSEGWVSVSSNQLDSLKSGVIAYSCSYTYDGSSIDNADTYTDFYLRDPDETSQPSDGGDADGGGFVPDLYYTKEESDTRYANKEDVYTKSQINSKGYLTSESDPVFTASAAHRISNSDIDNWNSKTSNTGTVTGVKLNGTTNSPTNGIVDLGTVITDVSDRAEKSEMQVRSSGTQTTIQLKTGTSATVVRDTNYVHTDNNYTTAEKTKLSEIADGAEANVQADWSVTNTSSDAYIKNKPTIPIVDTSITGKNQANPVKGGAIYTALQGKAGYKLYQDLDELEGDTPNNGTIGFDIYNEEFYIFNSPSLEWKQLDKPILNQIVSSSSNAVASRAIYSALAGKTGYIEYYDKETMDADLSQSNGTLGFDQDEEVFYIYNGPSNEWKQIDKAGDNNLKRGIIYPSNNVLTLQPSVINCINGKVVASNYTIALQSVDSSDLCPTYYLYVTNSIGKNKLTSLTYPSGTLWENGDVPDVNEFDNDLSLEWLLSFTRIDYNRILASIIRYKS